jgi:hypothetical protein
MLKARARDVSVLQDFARSSMKAAAVSCPAGEDFGRHNGEYHNARGHSSHKAQNGTSCPWILARLQHASLSGRKTHFDKLCHKLGIPAIKATLTTRAELP